MWDLQRMSGHHGGILHHLSARHWWILVVTTKDPPPPPWMSGAKKIQWRSVVNYRGCLSLPGFVVLSEQCFHHCPACVSGWQLFLAGYVTRFLVWINNQLFLSNIWHQHYSLFRFQITPCFPGFTALNHSPSDRRARLFVFLEQNLSWSYFKV